MDLSPPPHSYPNPIPQPYTWHARASLGTASTPAAPMACHSQKGSKAHRATMQPRQSDAGWQPRHAARTRAQSNVHARTTSHERCDGRRCSRWHENEPQRRAQSGSCARASPRQIELCRRRGYEDLGGASTQRSFPCTELSASSLLGGRACIAAYTIGHPMVSLPVRAVGIRVGGPVGCWQWLCQRSRKLHIGQVPVGLLRGLCV